MSLSSEAISFNAESSSIILRNGHSFSFPHSTGQLKEIPQQTSSTRSLSTASVSYDPLGDLLEEAEMETLTQYEITVESQTIATRSLETEMDRKDIVPIHFQIPAEADKDYLLLTFDEEEGYQWVFPQESRTVSRSFYSHLTFYISNPQSKDVQTRSLAYKAGRKLIRLIAWKSQDIVGRKALDVIGSWENKKRPYGLHSVNPREESKVSPLSDWNHLNQGKILLLIHGTFGTTKSSFGEMIDSTMYQELVRMYEGRIIAFNHPSLHHTPVENVTKLLEYLENRALTFDIITSSRGGLVARELIHQVMDNRLSIQIERALMVAAPNRGTVLADPEKMLAMIDRLTNLLTYLPVNIFSTIFESILAIVKILGGGAVAGLPGLQCQAPNNNYLKQLNQADMGNTQFFSISSDFSPEDASWLKRMGKKALDEMIDRVFGEANDGVVPTDGAYDTRPLVITESDTRSLMQPLFFYVPAPNRKIFRNNKNMHHLNYFTYREVQHKLVECLK